MVLRGGRCTLRRCVIEDGSVAGVQIGRSGLDRDLDRSRDLPEDRFSGTNNPAYGNRINDNADLAVVCHDDRG